MLKENATELYQNMQYLICFNAFLECMKVLFYFCVLYLPANTNATSLYKYVKRICLKILQQFFQMIHPNKSVPWFNFTQCSAIWNKAKNNTNLHLQFEYRYVRHYDIINGPDHLLTLSSYVIGIVLKNWKSLIKSCIWEVQMTCLDLRVWHP